MCPRLLALSAALVPVFLLGGRAAAQGAADADRIRLGSPGASLSLSGYAEVAYAYNFNQPQNGVTNWRGFDNRHDTFNVSNAVLDLAWSVAAVTGRVALQFGTTADALFLSEPAAAGTSSVNAAGAAVFRHLQQALLGWRAPVGRGLLIEAGLFLSPVGPEGLAVKDQWSWSRSSLFFALPFYHTGARLSYPFTDTLTVTLAGVSGWNSIIDNNTRKSLLVQGTFRNDRLTLNLIYLGGVERDRGAPEGQPWRHLFDASATLQATPRLALQLQLDGGFEHGELGRSSWLAAAAYARVQLVRWLFLSLRGDAFYHEPPRDADGVARYVFYPAPWVAAGTATVELRPAGSVAFYLESRADFAGAEIYFSGAVRGDGSVARPYVPNAASQFTLLSGMTTWF